jgi:diketogulonate reductase-like aldo/keto reductase
MQKPLIPDSVFSKKTSCGFEIPSLGIGTWEMGGRHSRVDNDDVTEVEAIRLALAMGMKHIDTAEIYGQGHAEELAAIAMEGMDRSGLFITSKVWSSHLRYDDVLRAAEGSLKRLKTNYLDLYLIHAPNPSLPLKETMKAMTRLIDEKIILWTGVSNFDVPLMKEAQSCCSYKIVANQVEYNLFTRNNGTLSKNMEKNVYPYCIENDLILIAWRPLDKGSITSGSGPILDEIALRYKKTPAQIAINWLISKKNIVTIPKASQKKHLIENAGALGWNLNEEDTEKLDRIAVK